MATRRAASAKGTEVNGAGRADRSVKDNSRRLYERVVEATLELIEDEGLQPGDAIPGEPELAKIFDVGRSTIREAMIFLENEGLIERSQGSRTTLTSLVRRPELGLEVLEPLEILAERQGWECGTVNLAMEAGRADKDQARRLRIEPGAEVTIITRVKTLDGRPCAHMLSVVSEDVVPYSVLRREFTDSVTRLIGHRFKLRYAEAELTALACPAPVARALEIKRGAPVVELTELFFSDDAQPIAWNVNALVPGTLRLELLRKVSPSRPSRDWVAPSPGATRRRS